MDTSTLDKVKTHLKRISWEIPFGQNRFEALGSRNTVASALSFLTQKGVIERVDKGFYIRTRPESVEATLTTTQLVRAWAKYNDHQVVRDGQFSAFVLGFLVDAPTRTVFWTSGPSREFKIGDEIVYTRRIASSKLLWPDSLEGDLYRGLLFCGYGAVDSVAIFKALRKRNIADKTRVNIINKISKQKLLNRWQGKLDEVKGMIDL